MVIVQPPLWFRNWGSTQLDGLCSRSLILMSASLMSASMLLRLLTNVPGCCQKASILCHVNLFRGLFVRPSNMVASFFQSEQFKRKQDRSHTIIYDLALEVIIIFLGFYESVLFRVRESHKVKNSGRQEPLGGHHPKGVLPQL